MGIVTGVAKLFGLKVFCPCCEKKKDVSLVIETPCCRKHVCKKHFKERKISAGVYECPAGCDATIAKLESGEWAVLSYGD
ncbi:MAG: hypothetical protein EOM12_10800 [Verrucomicrobiae bacterium]|nr:hypothetical protein [Verrucomicrobiae bacterium]